MDATIVCYTLENTTQTLRTGLNRVLNGYEDFSNNGKYRYKREGILHKIPHIKPHDSVIIIRKKDKYKLLKILRDYNAKIKNYDIQIDSKKLE